MKSTTLIQLIALPAVLGANFFELYILAETSQLGSDEHGTQVTGKRVADGEVTRMNSGMLEFMTLNMDHLSCLGDDGELTQLGCGSTEGRPEYGRVGQFDFSQATKDPRPFLLEYYVQDTVKEGSSRTQAVSTPAYTTTVPA